MHNSKFEISICKPCVKTLLLIFDRRSLGGKLGQQLEDKYKVEFMAQLVPIPLHDLQSTVGAKNG